MEITSEIVDFFSTYSNDEYAKGMKKYMRDKFEFFGIKSPIRKEIQKKYFSVNKIPDNLVPFIKSLWMLPERELQYFAMDILFKIKKFWKEEYIDLFEWLIIHKSWWDTVDYIAARLIGEYFVVFPSKKLVLTNKWITSENMWLERTAIIHQLSYGINTDWNLLKEFILFKIDSNEFFIQKAIGWALRQYAYKKPDIVLSFANEFPLKPLSRREALRRIT